MKRLLKNYQNDLAGITFLTTVFLLLQAIGACAGPAVKKSPMEIILLKDVSYGEDPLQRMDVYMPPEVTGAPTIFMVHGGAWRIGDKRNTAVVKNKVDRWVPKGMIFISTNYRMLPGTKPVEQAEDVARALAVAQEKAALWGGDPSKFILMGHSAGAHIVALLSADPHRAYRLGAKPWLGSIVLDSAALNVVELMEAKHARLYDAAFGNDPAYWKMTSPFHALSADALPMLLAYSTRRADSSSQVISFAASARSLDVKTVILPQDLSHRDMNLHLGIAGTYTQAVEAYLVALDKSIKERVEKPY